MHKLQIPALPTLVCPDAENPAPGTFPSKPSLLVSFGFLTATLAGLIGVIPFFGWMIAAPMALTTIIVAAVLIARRRTTSGILLFAYMIVGVALGNSHAKVDEARAMSSLTRARSIVPSNSLLYPCPCLRQGETRSEELELRTNVGRSES